MFKFSFRPIFSLVNFDSPLLAARRNEWPAAFATREADAVVQEVAARYRSAGWHVDVERHDRATGPVAVIKLRADDASSAMSRSPSPTQAVTIERPPRFEKAITFCGQPARGACDGKCSKAWGLSVRPRIRLSESDPDDYVWLADDELNDAPVEPETSEGGQHKPRDARSAEDMNKWCVRECERCVITQPGAPNAPLPLRDFSRRIYNIPSSAPARSDASTKEHR